MTTRPAASFRDPGGFCFALGERILRVVSPDSLAQIDGFLTSALAQKALESRFLVSTRRLADTELQPLRADGTFRTVVGQRAVGAVFEHETIPFPSYAYEWPPEMLASAGELTLDLAESALAEGFGLKDATPHNVLFRGPQPVFIDVLSFEKRVPDDPVWMADAQFQRTFLEELFGLCGPFRKLSPPFLPLVSMPVWLARKSGGGEPSLYRARRLGDAEKACFILGARFKNLRRHLQKLRPACTRSTWSGYMEAHSYEPEAFAAKEQFVSEALRELKPARVLDVGANTGHFSALAARAGAEVVAIDRDSACVGRIWQRARGENLNILPLVVDLARPSASLGWRNQECLAFLDRARGHFDAVLMLALLHHLLVTERVPLDDALDVAADLTRDALVIEFVAPQDEMFRRLARGRNDLYATLDAVAFEAACSRRFRIVRQARLGNPHRILYLLRKRADRVSGMEARLPGALPFR